MKKLISLLALCLITATAMADTVYVNPYGLKYSATKNLTLANASKTCILCIFNYIGKASGGQMVYVDGVEHPELIPYLSALNGKKPPTIQYCPAMQQCMTEYYNDKGTRWETKIDLTADNIQRLPCLICIFHHKGSDPSKAGKAYVNGVLNGEILPYLAKSPMNNPNMDI